MVILILIILLFFKLYIKNISNTHITLILIFVFVLYELYFYKDHFQNNEKFILNSDFLQHKEKQECIYKNQKEISEKHDIDSNKSLCYKINDLQQCNRTTNCKYDTELNKCIDILHDCDDNYKNISRIKCHFFDNEEKCNNLTEKLPDCNKLNEQSCENNSQCYFDYSNNKCEFKKSTCIGQSEEECSTNKDCLYKYYSDIYNIGVDSNLKECHDYNKFIDFNKQYIVDTIKNISLEKFERMLNNEYNYVNFYGYRLDSENNGTVYILNINDLSSLDTNSSVSLLNCFNKDQYVGNDNSISIFKKQGNCINNKKMCKWKNTSSFNCANILNKDDCNNNKTNCYFKDDKCINKGFCYDKCNINNNKSDCEKKVDILNEKMCFWDNQNQKCLNNECLYNKEKC